MAEWEIANDTFTANHKVVVIANGLMEGFCSPRELFVIKKYIIIV